MKTTLKIGSVAAAVLTAGALFAVPAEAKLGIEITSIRPGTTVRPGTTLTFRGDGGDDSSPPYLQFCLEQQVTARRWIEVACGPQVTDGFGTFALRARVPHAAHYHFYVRMYEQYSKHGARMLSAYSDQVTITVRAAHRR